jgi:MFS family permease
MSGDAHVRKVVVAASVGTALEWYDFFVYGALATILAKHFFSALPDAQAFILTLVTFAAGFVARPFGALVFGRIGDSQGRKGAFMATIVVMGVATTLIGMLPTYADAGLLAPIALVTLRLAQGFALGGEYGGAAIFVAEYSSNSNRGFSTSWIQASAAGGLVLALVLILGLRLALGEEAFVAWGWRLPFLFSVVLLAVSVWIRRQMDESPVFRAMKEQGRTTRHALGETFLRWQNLRLVLLALFALMMAQGVVFYTGYFYSQFFLEKILKVPGAAVTELMLAASLVAAVLYVFFGWLSDRVGRRPVMLFGMVLMLAAYFPGFHALAQFANPALAEAQAQNPVVVHAFPGDCALQLDLTGGAQAFTSSCDMAKSALANAGIAYTTEPAGPGAPAVIAIGSVARLEAPSLRGQPAADIRQAKKAFDATLKEALAAAGYPPAADMAAFDTRAVFAIIIVFMVAATALYGPLAACLVELFPARIRYTALSFPYHVGTGWFGGFMPAIAFAAITATGDIYAGLWYPFTITFVAFGLACLFLPETRGRDVSA